MLLELKVSNFATIDNAHIGFRPGLNILSGETGAGKSILIKSLGLLMGEKASGENVRSGTEQAIIEGRFDLSSRLDIKSRLVDMGIEALEDQLVVRRIVSAQTSKNRVYLNGSLSTLAGLRDVVAPLVEVTGQSAPLIETTGQHENRNLMSRAYHLDVLDRYSGVWKSRLEFSEGFARLRELREEIERIHSESRGRAQRLDFLIYQRDEIKAMDLKVGEEEELESETRRLKHGARLGDFAQQAEDTLYAGDNSITSRLHYVLQRAGELQAFDPSLSQLLEPLSQARALINDASYELRGYAKRLEAESDPGRLEELEDRLSRLRHLQKKFGATSSEILDALTEIEAEIDQLENSESILAEKESAAARLEVELKKMATEMHERRKSGATLLEKSVNEELADLNMKGVELVVQVAWTETLGPTGQSVVELLSRAGKSDLARSLTRFASGGELSRILLSIKQVVGSSEHPRTYLFDEVDTGVSGPTAEKVGRKLKTIAQGQQVICVTHLPQVASFGDAHFYIHKSEAKKNVQSEIAELRAGERVQEIARLISGERITKTSLAHAEQLLADSR